MRREYCGFLSMTVVAAQDSPSAAIWFSPHRARPSDKRPEPALLNGPLPLQNASVIAVCIMGHWRQRTMAQQQRKEEQTNRETERQNEGYDEAARGGKGVPKSDV